MRTFEEEFYKFLPEKQKEILIHLVKAMRWRGLASLDKKLYRGWMLIDEVEKIADICSECGLEIEEYT